MPTAECKTGTPTALPASRMGIFDAEGGLDACAPWRVLHVKPRQEKALSLVLCAKRINHYLPLVKQTRYFGRRKAVVDLPLFPGYLFLRGDREAAYQADRTGRVVAMIAVADQEALEHQLQQIDLVSHQDAGLEAHPYLHAGLAVEVRSGPFKGLQGLVAGPARQDRLILQVSVLGQASSLEIDGSLLEVIA